MKYSRINFHKEIIFYNPKLLRIGAKNLEIRSWKFWKVTASVGGCTYSLTCRKSQINLMEAI